MSHSNPSDATPPESLPQSDAEMLEEMPDESTDLEAESPTPPNRWLSVSHKLSGLGKTVGESAKQARQSVKTVMTDAGEAIAQTTAQTSQKMGDTVAATGKTVSSAASQAAITVANLGESATQQTHQALQQTTSTVGKAVAWVTDNPVLRQTTSMLNLDWLLGITDRIDLVKAEQAVRRLEEKHPQETPRQIAHHLMVEKTLLAGGTGLAGSFIPGLAAATFTVDLMATTLLQAELVYQIAAAYGLDLQDPARKGEVLAIFGLSLGGSRALKAGLGLLKTAPVAGAIIGASSNAVMLYTLGHAACQFYSVSHGTTALNEQDLDGLVKDTQEFQDHAIAQQTLMDQILVHMVLASHPDASWDRMLPSLEQVGLSPASLEAIALNLSDPPPLEHLLPQLDSTFTSSVFAQCERIARLDDDITAAEQNILDAIAQQIRQTSSTTMI
ncbi:MAG: hypothetical protein EA367_08475 [Leptolyngbya sp. DLM2.Bin15]|nr:MAG: hypothetical protein EA367_08475 [Leptolyngbya sp. DLM2.Bin15]